MNDEPKRTKLCQDALTRISKAWAAIRQGQPNLFTNASLDAAKDKVEAIWLTCRQDLASMDEFIYALDAWETENYKAIAALKVVR